MHKTLEGAATATPEERLVVLQAVLDSCNFAIIRRIAEIMLPLNADEKFLVLTWADRLFLTQDESDISDRDFTFHVLVNCEIPFDAILVQLKKHPTRSREALERLFEAASGTEDARSAFDAYCAESAEALTKMDRMQSRDRGRHMMITSAKTPEDWLQLANRLTGPDLHDLRQRVLERFLNECRNPVALQFMKDRVNEKCTAVITAAGECNRETAMYIHWMIRCAKAPVENKKELEKTATFLNSLFGYNLPKSVCYELRDYLPSYRQFAIQLPRSYSQSGPPKTVEAALAQGYEIKSESGRQVVVMKDGKSLTLYRPKSIK
ncbi:MAG: hypothetical protein WCJ29_03825 [bacterium]